MTEQIVAPTAADLTHQIEQVVREMLETALYTMDSWEHRDMTRDEVWAEAAEVRQICRWACQLSN